MSLETKKIGVSLLIIALSIVLLKMNWESLTVSNEALQIVLFFSALLTIFISFPKALELIKNGRARLKYWTKGPSGSISYKGRSFMWEGYENFPETTPSPKDAFVEFRILPLAFSKGVRFSRGSLKEEVQEAKPLREGEVIVSSPYITKPELYEIKEGKRSALYDACVQYPKRAFFKRNHHPHYATEYNYSVITKLISSKELTFEEICSHEGSNSENLKKALEFLLKRGVVTLIKGKYHLSPVESLDNFYPLWTNHQNREPCGEESNSHLSQLRRTDQ